jgi:hypothetical protein
MSQGLVEVTVNKPRFKAYSLTSQGRDQMLQEMERTSQELLDVARKLPNPLETAEALLTDEVLKRTGGIGIAATELSRIIAKEVVKNWLNLLLQQIPTRMSRAIENLEPGELTRPS